MREDVHRLAAGPLAVLRVEAGDIARTIRRWKRSPEREGVWRRAVLLEMTETLLRLADGWNVPTGRGWPSIGSNHLMCGDRQRPTLSPRAHVGVVAFARLTVSQREHRSGSGWWRNRHEPYVQIAYRQVGHRNAPGLRRIALYRSTQGRPPGSRRADNPRPPGANGDSHCTPEAPTCRESSSPTETRARPSQEPRPAGCSTRPSISDRHERKCPEYGTGSTPPTAEPGRAGRNPATGQSGLPDIA